MLACMIARAATKVVPQQWDLSQCGSGCSEHTADNKKSSRLTDEHGHAGACEFLPPNDF